EVAKEKAASEREAAQARIKMEQDIRAADIAREQKVREAEITHERDVALANQARDISLSEKSQEQSKAKAAADLAKAEGVKAAEAISTARAVADAERRRSVAVIAAQQEGQVRGQQLRMSAEAEKDAAVDRADARRAQAQAQADASEVLAAAKRQEMIAEADGQEALAKASNSYTESAIALKIDMARIEALPKVVSEMVRPAEKIDSIKIHHVTGLGRISGTGTSNEGHVVSEKSAINEAVDSVLDMAVQVPALKKIGEELGISVEDGIASMADDLAKKSSK
ncbi:MAG: flotillin domain-containing protein, partial [Rhodospirillales bacterium]|nr:flotillin domain-containing protein [Rhodospirillales bacterium]